MKLDAMQQSSSERDKSQTIREWVEAYTDELFQWAHHKTSNRELAEDLVQDTFLSAVKAFDKFEHRASPKTWLFTILNNKIIDHYRKAARKNKEQNMSEHQAKYASDAMFDKKDNWQNFHSHPLWEQEEHLLDNSRFNETLANCIKSLPPRWELAINGKYIAHKESKEICKELDISSSNYWQIIHRAKLLLRKCLETNWIE